MASDTTCHAWTSSGAGAVTRDQRARRPGSILCRYDHQATAIIGAGLGPIFSVAYLALGVTGIRLLRSLPDRKIRS